MMALRRPSARATLTILFVLIGAAWGGFLGLRHLAARASALDALENLSLDWRYSLAGPRTPPRGVVIAGIDEETIRQAGAFPLPRSALAQIVRGIARHNPQAICVDVLLLDPGNAEADRELADALHAGRSIIGAVALFGRDDADEVTTTGPGDAFIPMPSSILWPQEIFRAAAQPGLSNVSTDRSGVPRYVPLLFEYQGAIVPSFALASAAAALNTDPVLGTDEVKLRARSVALDLGFHLPLRFYGPSGSFKDFSAWQAVSGTLDPEDVRGQVVVLGATATGTGDRFATPFDRVTPGVEIFATAISNLIAGDGLVRDGTTRAIDAAIAVALPGIAVLLLALRPFWLAIVLTTLAFLAWIGGLDRRIQRRLLAELRGAGGRGHPDRGDLRRRTAMGRAARGRAHGDGNRCSAALPGAGPARAAREGPAAPDEAGPPGGRDRVRRSFRLHRPDRSARAGLDAGRAGRAARAHRAGGDRSPRLRGELHGRRRHDGVRAAERRSPATPSMRSPPSRSSIASITEWLQTLPPVARGKLAPRFGSHFGPVILSRLGAADHQHIAATGDTVNVASRLMEVAKQRGAPIAVSEDLCRAAGLPGGAAGQPGGATGQPGEACALELGEPVAIDIRGRAEPLSVRFAGLGAVHA